MQLCEDIAVRGGSSIRRCYGVVNFGSLPSGQMSYLFLKLEANEVVRFLLNIVDAGI